MNKENLLKWADALESGKYDQIHGQWGNRLRDVYCCLNVACMHFNEFDINSSSKDIDYIFTEIFGKDFIDHIRTFYHMNDELEMKFPEIATKVRELSETGEIHLES